MKPEYKEVSFSDWVHFVYGKNQIYICVVSKNGDREYYKDNKLHNEYGPAVIYVDVDVYINNGLQYYYEGKQYFPKSDDEWIKFCKLKAFI